MMPKINWTEEERNCEWAFAKTQLIQDGELLPKGTKLRRKDYPELLKHSFIVIDNKILAMSGKGLYLGKGVNGRAKLAEDEDGVLFALKIMRDLNVSESEIAQDLGVAGTISIRPTKYKNYTEKNYLAYKYLGMTLENYLKQNKLLLDDCYKLSIKVTLVLHDLHTGKKSLSGKPYLHGDIHTRNIVIDEEGVVHLIDFGETPVEFETERFREEIIFLLLVIFRPAYERNGYPSAWIFPDEMKKRSNIELLDKHKFLETSESFPTTLDIAGTLTLCRFNMESYQATYFDGIAEADYLLAINILNKLSTLIFSLYEALPLFSNHSDKLLPYIKTYLIALCLTKPVSDLKQAKTAIESQLTDEEASAIMTLIDGLESAIEQEKFSDVTSRII